VKKKKTPNAQRPTSNSEIRTWRVAEIFESVYSATRKRSYDLEDWLLEFAAKIIELTESLPNTRAGTISPASS
jgi:hypothetical protein